VLSFFSAASNPSWSTCVTADAMTTARQRRVAGSTPPLCPLAPVTWPTRETPKRPTGAAATNAVVRRSMARSRAGGGGIEGGGVRRGGSSNGRRKEYEDWTDNSCRRNMVGQRGGVASTSTKIQARRRGREVASGSERRPGNDACVLTSAVFGGEMTTLLVERVLALCCQGGGAKWVWSIGIVFAQDVQVRIHSIRRAG